MKMKKIYIVEDDQTIAGAIAEYLASWQMQCRCAEYFERIIEEVKEFEPDLILMDLKLPYFNGFYWCGEIRKFSQVPIVFISSADDNMNIVMAMNMGADDFISKPFDLQVLTAKFQAVLRRCPGASYQTNFLACGEVSLNLDDASVSVKGERLELTKNEFLILKTLLENQGRVVSRDHIMERLWGNEEFVDDNTLTVNMTRLRRKIETAGMQEFIKTKRGLGYLIDEE